MMIPMMPVVAPVLDTGMAQAAHRAADPKVQKGGSKVDAEPKKSRYATAVTSDGHASENNAGGGSTGRNLDRVG